MAYDFDRGHQKDTSSDFRKLAEADSGRKNLPFGQEENGNIENDEKVRQGIPPLYIEFCFWEQRLATFDDGRYKAISKGIHSCQELAAGGFFYTGVGDCVRCFYCGLGLRGWTTTDNMYVEHQRYRDNCGFLKVVMESGTKVDYELMMKDGPISSRTKPLSNTDIVDLLQAEKKYHQKRYLCRMCFRNPARELLLPCGEMLICHRCADITSTCPSCRQKILATTTVFMG